MKLSNTVEATANRVARTSYGKLVAYLAARSRDVASAEDALAEAFTCALEQWPLTGAPDNPDAWLLTVARRKQIDAARRRKTGALAEPHLHLMAEEIAAAQATGMSIPDHRLALMFACAHPAIDPAVRTPLMLQTVLGLDAATIASAFLVSPAAMSQRLVRAKAKIKEAGIPFHVPAPEDLAERLDAVLDAIYVCFTDGWSDAQGTEPARQQHWQEAVWLGRLAVSLLPDQPEALALLALMLYAESRRPARRDSNGNYLPLPEQNPDAWDGELISEAEALVLAASRLAGMGRFQLQAAIQSAHAARRKTGYTDWPAIVQLYDVLLAMTRSSVVAINRAVAISQARGPEAGLAALAEVEPDSAITQYQPYWAAKAALLAGSGDGAGADTAYGLAIGLESDPAVREFLLRRRQTLRQ